MNRTDAGLPLGMMAGQTAVAALAAMGFLSLLPVAVPPDFSWIAGAGLTGVLAAGLVVSGHRAVSRARQVALDAATTDPDTGLSTPDAAEQVLAMEFAAAQRGRPLALVLIRLEQVHVYQGKHGTVVTRRMLRLASRALRKHRRSMHVTAHYGQKRGSYLSILSGMDLDGAVVYAKRVRRELMLLSGVPGAPPVSVGVATYDISMNTPAELLMQAERALDKAGASGGKLVAVGQLSTEVGD